MADGKCASEGKRETSYKCAALDTETKLKTMHKYVGGQNLS
jgi:hypothetical protein